MTSHIMFIYTQKCIIIHRMI